MSKTYSAGYSNVTLTNPTYNPVYVTGTITGTGSALEGASPTAWMIINSGLIAGGAVTSTAGVRLDAGGSVSNAAGGTINGYIGIAIYGGGGTVLNAGSVQGIGAASDGGVFLSAGGYVGNASGGGITGANGVVELAAASTLVNAGAILGTVFAGALMYQGVVTNQAGGAIVGPSLGVDFTGAPATVVNYGTITESGGSGFGIDLTHGGTIVNQSAATIASPAFDAITIASGFAVIQNAGSILSSNGIFLSGAATGLSITNQSGGVIASTLYDLDLQNHSVYTAVVNAGSILSSKLTDAVYLHGGGTVSNLAGGLIQSAKNAIAARPSSPLTVVNAGTLIGGVDAVAFAAGFSGDRLIVDPGAVFSGGVDGGNAIGSGHVTVLELASGASAGTLAGLGAQYVHFANVTVDSSAAWTLAAASLGAGYTIYDGGTLTNTGSLGSTVTLAAGAQLTNAPGAIINASGVAVTDAASGQVVNLGLLASSNTAYSAIALDNGGSITNAASGTILAAYHDIYLKGGGTVFNAGMIAATGAHTISVGLLAGSANSVIVSPGASFVGRVDGGNTLGATAVSTLELASGAAAGMLNGLGTQYFNFADIAVDSGADWSLASAALGTGYTVYDSGTLTNQGSLGSTVTLRSGGVVTNALGALINGGAFGGIYGAPGGTETLVNYGSITASGVIGLNMAGVAVVTNASGGTIHGGASGIYLYHGGTIVNDAGGTIIGGLGIGAYHAAATIINAGSIYGIRGVFFHAGYASRLIVDPGASFSGGVDGGNTVGSSVASSLELASGASAGTLNGLGTQFYHFADVAIDAGAYWVLTADTLGAGYTIADDGTLTNTGSLGSPVTLGAGANLINAAGATIATTAANAVYAPNGGSVMNAGFIAGATDAVLLGAGGAGALAVAPGASFTGLVDGGNTIGATVASTLELLSAASAGTLNGLGAQIVNFTSIQVDNSATWTFASAALGAGYHIYDLGTLTNRGSIGSAVTIAPNGAFTNAASAVVANAGSPAAVLGITSVTVVNAGTVSDNVTKSDGVKLNSGGAVANLAGGTISGYYSAVGVYGSAGNVTNAGLIVATGTNADGVFLGQGGVVINEVGGTISDTFSSIYGAVEISGTSTVVNAGTIIGATYAVTFYPGFADRLIVDPGAVFSGTVAGGNTFGATIASYIELASGASAGTLSGLGAQFINFAQVTLDAGARWDMQDPVPSGETIQLATGAYLQLANPGSVAGSVVNFAAGETIDLVGVDPASVSFASGTLSFSGGSFALALNGASGVKASASSDGAIVVTCFREGTRIATTKGEIPVERLAIGDGVHALRERLPITWIGRRRIDCRRHPKPQLVWPVCVARGAFGGGMPHRDLWLSPDHAVYLNGVLIPVKHLINGTTIAQVPVGDVTYYHVELPHHDVLLAEGLPVESYLETGDRANFDDGGVSLRLHPDFSSRTWEARGCAPLVVAGPPLAAARAVLKEIALSRRSAA